MTLSFILLIWYVTFIHLHVLNHPYIPQAGLHNSKGHYSGSLVMQGQWLSSVFGQGCCFGFLPRQEVGYTLWLLGTYLYTFWRGETRSYAQQLGRTRNWLPCLGRAINGLHGWYSPTSPLAANPNQAELPIELPGLVRLSLSSIDGQRC